MRTPWIAQWKEQAALYFARYWGVLVFVVWAGALLALGVVRTDAYGIEEGAARALLLNWSVADNVQTPIVITGLPDFRGLFFIPLGLYWSGSMLAAKLYTLFIAWAAVAMLYRWIRQTANTEAALFSAALLLISPALINQVDALGVGVYLLLALALASWLDETYRHKARPLGGWFFVHMLMSGIATSLHPMGLAYPLATLWRWYKYPENAHQRRHIFIGLIIVTAVVLAMRQGWQDIAWLANPWATLGNAFLGQPFDGPSAVIAASAIALTVVVLWWDRKNLFTDMTTTALFFALLIGLGAADNGWALLLAAFILTRGMVHVHQLTTRRSGGLVSQRGGIMLVLFMASTLSMLALKAHREMILSDRLTVEDALIKLLATEAADRKRPFKAAAQWPARAMLVCKRDVLPLPPVHRAGKPLEGAAFMASIKGLTHIAYNPFLPRYQDLSRVLATLNKEIQTLALVPGGGVVLKVNEETSPSVPLNADTADNKK